MRDKKGHFTKKVDKTSWTEDEEALLFELKWNALTYKIIASTLGRSISSCEKKYRNTQWEQKPFYDSAKNRLKDHIKQELVNKVVEAKEKKLSSVQMSYEILADRIEAVVKALPEIKNVPYKNTAKSKKSPEDVGLIVSDTHVGHEHSFEETGGLSEYNLDIFKKRVEFLTNTAIKIVDLHSKLYELPNLHIFCLGDIVAGMNGVGAWNSTYINMSIIDQAVAGADALAGMIYSWLKVFKNIYFYGIAGNHSRGAAKGIEKEYVNWDYITYKFLEARFNQNPRIKFTIPKSWWLMETIRNHKFLLVHGDDVKGSLALKGLATYTEKMSNIFRDTPDYVLAGHFHSAAELSTNYGRLIINGAFTGADIYSLKDLQKASKPEQKIFGIHDEQGITWTYNINLEKAK